MAKDRPRPFIGGSIKRRGRACFRLRSAQVRLQNKPKTTAHKLQVEDLRTCTTRTRHADRRTKTTPDSMGASRYLKAGVSLWAIQFALAVVLTIVAMTLAVALGGLGSSPGLTNLLFTLGLFAAGFATSWALFRPLCGWVGDD